MPEVKPRLELSFSAQGTHLEIEGDERDKVFVLFSDVREYLTEEVNKGFYLSKQAKQILAGAMMFAFLATFLSFMAAEERSSHLTNTELKRVTASRDVAAKLDALLTVESRKAQRGIPVRGMLIFFAIVLVLGADLPERSWSYIWPSNVFLFGAQKIHFDRKRKVIANVFWIVVIGGAVSILAALVANNVSLWHR